MSALYLKPDPKLIHMLEFIHSGLSNKQNQSIRNGTEFSLLDCHYKLIHRTIRVLLDTINNGKTFSGIWSSFIKTGGSRVPHNHPQGEISGCWYLRIPENSPLCFENSTYQPKPGEIVLFPSNTVHWVQPHPKTRLTIAFDMI